MVRSKKKMTAEQFAVFSEKMEEIYGKFKEINQKFIELYPVELANSMFLSILFQSITNLTMNIINQSDVPKSDKLAAIEMLEKELVKQCIEEINKVN